MQSQDVSVLVFRVRQSSILLEEPGVEFEGSTILRRGPGLLSQCSDWLRAGRSGDRIPVGARFFPNGQTGPGAHAASCTMGAGYFPGLLRDTFTFTIFETSRHVSTSQNT
jgi:hypothetical protein